MFSDERRGWFYRQKKAEESRNKKLKQIVKAATGREANNRKITGYYQGTFYQVILFCERTKAEGISLLCQLKLASLGNLSIIPIILISQKER